MSLFNKIPNEILNSIFNYTNIHDILSYRSVCKRFNQIIKNYLRNVNIHVKTMKLICC